MRTILKLILCAVGITLAGIAFWIYSSFFGDPISAVFARQEMERYLSATYPGKVFVFQDFQYDFKFGRFEAVVVEGNQNKFILAGSASGVQYDQYRYEFAMDDSLTARLSEQFGRDLDLLLKERFPAIKHIDAEIYVAKDEYPPDMQYQKGMERKTELQISLVGDDPGEKAFVQLCADVRDTILEAGYWPQSIYFLYNGQEMMEGKEGMLLYTLDIEPGAYKVEAADLGKNVRQFNLQHRKQQP